GAYRTLRGQGDPREQGTRAQPPVPQHQGRDDLPLVRKAALRDRDRRQAHTARNASWRGRPRHAEDGPPHDRARRLRHPRGLDARAHGRGAAQGRLREGREGLIPGSGNRGIGESEIGTIDSPIQPISRYTYQNGMSSSFGVSTWWPTSAG